MWKPAQHVHTITVGEAYNVLRINHEAVHVKCQSAPQARSRALTSAETCTKRQGEVSATQRFGVR